LTLILVRSLAKSSQSQTPAAAIEGAVTDQTGAAVLAAKVTITETATQSPLRN